MHQSLRLAGQIRLAEHADAEIDGFLQRQLFPLFQQGFLRPHGFGSTLEYGFDRLFDFGIECAFGRNHIDQTPIERGRCIDGGGGHDQPARTAPTDQARQEGSVNHRGDTDPDLGHGVFGIMRRDPEIAGGSKFEAAAKAPAGDAGDHRRGKSAGGFAEIAQAGNELLGGGLIQRRHFLDVGAANHALFALAGDDKRANGAFRGQYLDALANALDCG